MPPLPANSYVPHMRLAMGGPIGDPPIEIWSCSVRFMFEPVYVPTPVDLQDMANAAGPVIQAWFGSADAAISHTAALGYVKCSWILDNGRQRDPISGEFDYGTGAIGGIGGETPPWQVSLALTETTALKKGRGHAGRIYPPLVTLKPEDGTPYVSQDDATQIGTAYAGLLSDLNDAIRLAPTNHLPGTTVASVLVRSNPSRGLTATFQHITGVQVDRVPDTQRRRTNRVSRQVVPIVAVNAT